MNKPYKLTSEQIEELVVRRELRCTCGLFDELAMLVAHEAQKKLLEYMKENDLLSHLSFPGATPTKPCEMCQLLRDFGIS